MSAESSYHSWYPRAVVSVTVCIGYGDIPYYIGFCHVDGRFNIAK
jgi:hypothetical protein